MKKEMFGSVLTVAVLACSVLVSALFIGCGQQAPAPAPAPPPTTQTLVPIKCQNPGCTNPTNTVATYRHPHADGTTKEWTVPALGPTPDSAPHPEPCPDDQTLCQAVSVKCNTCGWTKVY